MCAVIMVNALFMGHACIKIQSAGVALHGNEKIQMKFYFESDFCPFLCKIGGKNGL